MSDILEFAAQFFNAVEGGDIDAVAGFYRDDVTVWHNFDNVNQTREDNLATLAGISGRYDAFGYEDVRHTAVEDGFLRQHVIKATIGEKTVNVPAILRVYVESGKIHRIEEYFDRGQLDVVFS
ncbi:nuclear transport factor 2 family protein [Rhodococcus sp. ARC_M6]|uniref:nuclear transport factor 2 family protein n=1 Tax=Rhodococcus sp. ARC_M6 TaxID=2928852 RepID=UPI001FB46C69|nr:nuclear transport factor 2 family protein [Rhodococcus sp. ARC_M6]MCJ0905019.1 nuclear transport factor 2 family protein [Rhodococcus sp. ARC_M6]